MTRNRINLISGPRNISTALMYSFASRPDTTVVDEPMYAYYLDRVDVDHPGKSEILSSLPRHLEDVLDQYFFQEISVPNLFIKGMAHHYEGIEDLSFLTRLKNIFLIRHPEQLIASFAQVIHEPVIRDIGIKHEYELFCHLKNQGVDTVVLDSNEILLDPSKVLHELCNALNIDFDVSMLSWDTGKKAYDGVWAPYWYENVWKSNCFKKQKTSSRPFPQRLSGLLEEANQYYNLLSEQSIRA